MSTRDSSRYTRTQTEKLRSKNHMLIIMSVLCILIACLSFFGYTKQTEKVADLQDELTDLKCNYIVEELYDGDTLAYAKECETTISSLYEAMNALYEQNESLVISNNDYYEKLLVYQEREELFDKYEYAIIRIDDSSRTDITYDQLETIEDLCEEFDIDTELLFAIVMVESNGKEDATNALSTARGYGQFLDVSGEWVYEKLMGLEDYDHDYAYDGTTNLTMMAYYLNYLYDVYDDDLYSVLYSYRGMGGSVLSTYISKLDEQLAVVGTSVEALNGNV